MRGRHAAVPRIKGTGRRSSGDSGSSHTCTSHHYTSDSDVWCSPCPLPPSQQVLGRTEVLHLEPTRGANLRNNLCHPIRLLVSPSSLEFAPSNTPSLATSIVLVIVIVRAGRPLQL